MPKVQSSKSFFNNKPKDSTIPIPPIPPFVNGMPPPIPTLPNINMSEKLQQFHQQHFTQPTFPISMFMPFPFHPTNNFSVANVTQPSSYQDAEPINYEEKEIEEEEYDENVEKELPMSEGNPNNISFVLSKETIEMFRHSELYRQKCKVYYYYYFIFYILFIYIIFIYFLFLLIL